MTKRHFIRFLIRITLMIITIVPFAGCGIATSMNKINATLQNATQNAIDSMDRAIAALSQQSADWRIVVQDLEKDLSADMQSTIRTEVTNLTQAAILTAGVEVRCNAEFMRVSLERELIKLRNKLVKDLNAELDSLGWFKGHTRPVLQPEKLAQPFICSMVPSAVDLNLEPVRRTKIDIFGFDFRSKPITVSLITSGKLIAPVKINLATFKTQMSKYVKLAGEKKIEKIETDQFVLDRPVQRFRTNVSNALSVVSDFHAVLDLTESGFDLLPTSKEIVLSWDDKIQSEIAILTHQKFLQCENVSVPVSASKQTFIPPALESNLYGKIPDKDFDGNGPCVNFSLSLMADVERKNIKAHYSMDAWESTGNCTTIHDDYTEATGSGSVNLFTAAENEKILSFDVDNNMTDSFYQQEGDTSQIPINRYFSGTTPVTQLQYVGDTKGPEAGTKTGVTIFFRQFKVQVERCELK